MALTDAWFLAQQLANGGHSSAPWPTMSPDLKFLCMQAAAPTWLWQMHGYLHKNWLMAGTAAPSRHGRALSHGPKVLNAVQAAAPTWLLQDFLGISIDDGWVGQENSFKLGWCHLEAPNLDQLLLAINDIPFPGVLVAEGNVTGLVPSIGVE